MPFLAKGKTNWKYILIILILALIVGGGASWYAKRLEKPYQPVEIKKSEKVSFEQLSTCNIDSDCILVSHKSCGGIIKISINKKYESLYNSTPKFQDSTGEICKTRGISYDEQKQIIEGQTPMESLCLNGKCRPKYVEEIANWKTYRNEEYGFELRYPENWQVSETPKEVIAQKKEQSLYYKNLLGEAMFCHYRDHAPEAFWCGVLVSVYTAPEESLKEYYKAKEKLYGLEFDLQKEEDIILGNQIQAVKFIFASTKPNKLGSEVIVAIQKGGKIIEIKDKWAFSLEDLEFAKIFNQILSTFKFLE
jgi:hypothetical protein